VRLDDVIEMKIDESDKLLLPDGATTTRTPPIITNNRTSNNYTYVNNPPKTFQGSHLYIMVHGLAGNPWDMRLFRNQIALNFPESEFLICSCVEQNTLGDIEEMGNSVAKEIVEYLTSTTLNIGKISFVGHSLGGVIIRAALCDSLLAPYLHKLYTFVSLSVPHIGTLYPYSALIPGAMWVWQKWSNSSCLLQLRLLDDPDLTKTYLYKLSQKKRTGTFPKHPPCLLRTRPLRALSLRSHRDMQRSSPRQCAQQQLPHLLRATTNAGEGKNRQSAEFDISVDGSKYLEWRVGGLVGKRTLWGNCKI